LIGRPISLFDGKVAGSIYKKPEGPPLIWGQGGRGMVRVVSPPFLSGNVTITGVTPTLGKIIISMGPDPVIFTLEKGMLSVII